MKSRHLLIISFLLVFLLVACGNASIEESKSPQDEARQQVIDKWEKAANVVGTARFIEDTYKKYPNDEVIANIYFYCIAKQEYGYFQQFSYNEGYLNNAKEYAAKIDPNYSGVFSEEMHVFVNSIIPAEEIDEKHSEAKKQEDILNSLTEADKKAICEYIEERYDYYDKMNGGYAGDKYSDTIMQEAADLFGLSVSQIEIIWMNMYSYK